MRVAAPRDQDEALYGSKENAAKRRPQLVVTTGTAPPPPPPPSDGDYRGETTNPAPGAPPPPPSDGDSPGETTNATPGAAVRPYAPASPWNTPLRPSPALDPSPSGYVEAIADNGRPLSSDPDK